MICSYCRAHTGDKEALDDEAVSPGMCDECFDHFDHQFAGMALEDYLEGFRAPVIIVNHEGRIAAANNAAANMLNKPPREVFGLLGGEAMECMYARLPEGCGKTVHTAWFESLLRMSYSDISCRKAGRCRIQPDGYFLWHTPDTGSGPGETAAANRR